MQIELKNYGMCVENVQRNKFVFRSTNLVLAFIYIYIYMSKVTVINYVDK